MTQFVQKFIEENITIIEQQEWGKLFDNWYFSCSMRDPEIDFKQLHELFQTFSSVGINLREQSEIARQSLIVKHMHEYIKEKQFLGEETVTWAGAVNSLQSRLGVGLLDLKKLFQDVCDSEGLERTSQLKVNFKL